MHPHASESEQAEVSAFMRQFLDACFTERDYKKAASCADENVMCVGLRLEEIGQDRSAMEALLQNQMQIFPSSVEYFIQNEIPKDMGNHWWSYYGQIALRAMRDNWGIVRYVIRLMAAVHKIGSAWKIQTVHISEAGIYGENPQSISLVSPSCPEETPKLIHPQDLSITLNQLLPGGIVSRIASEYFPFSFANSQFLRISGYPNLESMRSATQDSFIRLLHPEDVENFRYIAHFLQRTGKQCECDYRIRRKDGSYLWVHDVGRKAVSGDGRELIVSIVTDISHRVEKLRALEKESEIDYLTNIYNRKGAITYMEKHFRTCRRCALLIIDLDNFKNVNDQCGHFMGDQALQFAAKLLSDAFAHQGTVCRMGGDEFMVFLPDYTEPAHILQALEDIAKKYRSYMQDLAPYANATLSIGGVYGSKADSLTEKYRLADANLYKIKNGKKDGIQFTAEEE